LAGAQIFIGILAASLVFGITYIADHKLNIPISIISILAGVLASILYPQVNRKATIRRVKKLLAEGDNKTLLGHQVISFSPEGIFAKSQTSESKITWSAIDKVTQTDKHFFLYTSSINALVIPKKCFRSEKESKEFWDYINQYCEGLIYA
jgi:hypothetical protein